MTIKNGKNQKIDNPKPVDQEENERNVQTKNTSKHALNDSEKIILENRGYKVSNSLGSGGYGKVYVGYFNSKSSGQPRLLACKVIDTENAGENYVKKFLPRELAIMVKVNHPHIIHLHSILTNDSKIYIFMRYAENGDLSSYLKQNGAISEELARVWTRQLALALQYLHMLNIAHRDIKCKNVLITSKMNVKLCDFGFSRLMLDEKGHYILSKSFCGTISYLAPEVLQHKEYDAKCADMWSLGVLLFAMLNNRLPFRLIKGRVQLKAQLEKNFRYSRQQDSKLSIDVKHTISCLLEPDTSRRWNATDLIQCEWIAMNKELQFMDQREYDAFILAADYKQYYEAALTNIMHKFRRSTQQSRHNSDLKEHLKNQQQFLSFYKSSGAFVSFASAKSEIEFFPKVKMILNNL